MPQMAHLRELLIHELADLLYAERRFLTGTKRFERETDDPEIKSRIAEHVRETETHIERIEQAFTAIGEKAKSEKCDAAIGLREEHDSFKTDEKPTREVLQAFDLGSELRVEHYEIAAYRSAIALAQILEENECATILRQSLREEEAMASVLEESAPRALKRLHDAIA